MQQLLAYATPAVRPPSARRPSLDAFDRAILRMVQRDNKTPQRTIAEGGNLSAAPVQRRIAAMEDTGVMIAARTLARLWLDSLSLMTTSPRLRQGRST